MAIKCSYSQRENRLKTFGGRELLYSIQGKLDFNIILFSLSHSSIPLIPVCNMSTWGHCSTVQMVHVFTKEILFNLGMYSLDHLSNMQRKIYKLHQINLFPTKKFPGTSSVTRSILLEYPRIRDIHPRSLKMNLLNHQPNTSLGSLNKRPHHLSLVSLFLSVCCHDATLRWRHREAPGCGIQTGRGSTWAGLNHSSPPPHAHTLSRRRRKTVGRRRRSCLHMSIWR